LPLVVDASVAVKWFVEEELSSEARRLLRPDLELVAPDFILTEAANVLLKKVRRGEMPAEVVEEALDLLNIFALLSRSVALVPAAFTVAKEYGRSVYDALYVAMALQEGCQIVTADKRLYKALREVLPGSLLWIEDVS
jgi:predicted nucleic acid-binding protein